MDPFGTKEMESAPLTGWVVRALATPHARRVPRKAKIPPQLTHGPFTLAEARAAGLTLSALKGKAWQRLGNELYCSRGWRRDPWAILAAWNRMYPEVIFSGLTAAWMHGLDCDPVTPAHVIAPIAGSLRSCDGLHVRRCELQSGDVVALRGALATSVHRTLRDLCVELLPIESLIYIDMALRLALTDRDGLMRDTEHSAGLPGSRLMRSWTELAEPAESQMETRLRWLLHCAALPRPQVQTDLRDTDGRFVARADLYYPQARLVVEFDGGNHRERLISDDRRQNQLVNAGYTLLRFTSADLREKPDVLVAQVRAALANSARLVPSMRKNREGSDRLAPKGRIGHAAA